MIPCNEHVGFIEPSGRDAGDWFEVNSGVLNAIVDGLSGDADQVGQVGVSAGVAYHNCEMHQCSRFKRTSVRVAINHHWEDRGATEDEARCGAFTDPVERSTERIDLVSVHVACRGRQELQQHRTSVVIWTIGGHQFLDSVRCFSVGKVVHRKGVIRGQVVKMDVSSKVVHGNGHMHGHPVLNGHHGPGPVLVLVEGFVHGDLKGRSIRIDLLRVNAQGGAGTAEQAALMPCADVGDFLGEGPDKVVIKVVGSRRREHHVDSRPIIARGIEGLHVLEAGGRRALVNDVLVRDGVVNDGVVTKAQVHV